MKFPIRRDGEVFRGTKTGARKTAMLLACCDCGLVHRLEVSETSRGLTFRAWREEEETRSERARRLLE